MYTDVTISVNTKLRQLGVLNKIVDDSDSKLFKFNPQFRSNSNLTTKIEFQLKDNLEIRLNTPIF